MTPPSPRVLRTDYARFVKLWKKLLLGGLGLAGLLFVVGCFLPAHAHIERSLLMHTTPASLFPSIATLNRWPDWTAWNTNRFPDLTMRFEGPATGVGATMIASGKSSGDGTVKITEADLASGITYTLDFNHGTQLFTGAIRHTNTPDGLRVTWTLDADLGANPLKRWTGLALGALMGGDMEKGLANLKRAVEPHP